MKIHNLTAAALGKAVGVSSNFIREIELGKKYPSVPVLCRIADFLNVSIDELLANKNVNEQSISIIMYEIAEKMRHLSPENLSIVTDVKFAHIDRLLTDDQDTILFQKFFCPI